MSKGFIRSHQSSFSTFYRIVDIIIICSCLLLSSWLNNHPLPNQYLLACAATSVIFLLSAESLDLYRSWRTIEFSQLIYLILISWALSCACLVIGLYFTKFSHDFSRLVMGTWMTLGLVSLLLWRVVLRRLLFLLRWQGFNSRTAILIGATQTGIALAQELKQHPELGIRFKGFYDDRHPSRIPENISHELRGNLKDAIELAKSNQVDMIYIAMPLSATNRIQHILDICGDTTVTVHIIPDFFTYNLLHARLHNVGKFQTLSIYDTPIDGLSGWTKRLEDIVLASCILIFVSIPMILISLIIKLTTRGPVLFKQKRYGLDGRLINVYKFRTMNVMENGSAVIQAKRNDHRVTRFGKFLRYTSLDELPQFFNVLQGRMSVVGPRPHAVAHNEEYRKLIGGYMLRHKVKPGITGWAQINGWRGETETLDKMESRVQYDLEYIRHWSIWLDLKIVVLTIFTGFVSKNSY